jgi:hypothetical protein
VTGWGEGVPLMWRFCDRIGALRCTSCLMRRSTESAGQVRACLILEAKPLQVVAWAWVIGSWLGRRPRTLVRPQRP